MSISEIIDALGGPSVVARALGQPVTTVANWAGRNRIPGWHHAAIVRISGGRFTADQIDAAHDDSMAA
jgi:hypothetical protein